MKREYLNKNLLRTLYTKQKWSVSQISRKMKCSENKINYWLKKYDIKKRSISDATYIKHNPKGDPFKFSKPKDSDEAFLMGLGLGLYWGEGNKKNLHSVRLGNTDPALVKKFIEFLEKIYNVEKRKFKYGIQVFSDMSQKEVLSFWSKRLGVSKERFGHVTVTPERGVGNYREKTKTGVLTVYVSNVKLRNSLIEQIEKLR